MERKSQPKVLQKSVRYPTYQLNAVADRTRETPENQLVICALSVLEWTRTKFREFEIPASFQAPPPDEYQSVSLENLKNAHIEAGYTVETACIPQEKAWAFRLTEPDLGTRWDGKQEVSTAVPGRIFETNIAFHVAGEELHCGVNVIVSEPENTESPCRVSRPAVVQRLASNPLVGLSSGRLLENQMWELDSRGQLTVLRKALRDGCLPAVIFCDYQEAQPAARPAAAGAPALLSIPAISALPAALGSPALPRIPTVPAAPAAVRKKAPSIPYNVSLFTSARMAYVHSCHLPADQFALFRKLFQIEAKNGSVIFMEPMDLGNGYRVFEYSGDRLEETFSGLMDLSRDYLRKKSVKYERVIFLAEAKLLLIDQLKKANMGVEDTARMYEEQQELLKQAYEDKLMAKNERIEQQASKITRLQNLLDERDQEIKEAREAAREEAAQAEARVEDMRGRLEFLESLPLRPKTPREVAAWVQERFPDRLEMHARAVKKLEAVPPNSLDMRLLCDALEYLAREYRDQRSGRMSRDEANRRSSEKYGRPFEVAPCGSTAIEMYSKEYKVKYAAGAKGAAVETPLTEHLKVGNTGGSLLRIYFFYDKANQKIVVGSLPNHLPTAQIQG